MKKHARTIAASVLIGSVGFNVSAVVIDLWRHDIGTAAVQSVVVALLVAWLAARPKLDAWLDARIAGALAQQASAEVVLEELRRLQRAGELQFGATLAGSVARTH